MENALSFMSSLSPTLNPTSFPSNLPSSNLRLTKLTRSTSVEQQRSRARFVRNASSSDEKGQPNGFARLPDIIHEEEAIGAEYGEGFETFRPEGPLKVDVDFLNDRLQEGFLQRIRYAMKPDEAYGLIFSWDNVVVNTRAFALKGWELMEALSEEGKDFPADVDYDLKKLLEPMEGLREWLDAVATSRIPCAIVSSRNRKTMVDALETMGLKKYFQAIVSEEDGMESIAHRFLSAAVKLDRKPSKCIVFEDDPRAITAAHNCTMMAVALIGAHPAYELGQADLAVGSYNELSVINLRRLFANKGSTFMDLQRQVIEKTPRRRKLTIDTIF